MTKAASTASGKSSSAKKSASASKKSASKKSESKAYSKSSRCWPGFEPVPGKAEHEEGSCRKKPASRNAGKPVKRETARKKQIARGGKRAEQAHMKSPDAAERHAHSKAATKKKAPAKKPAQSRAA